MVRRAKVSVRQRSANHIAPLLNRELGLWPTDSAEIQLRRFVSLTR